MSAHFRYRRRNTSGTTDEEFYSADEFDHIIEEDENESDSEDDGVVSGSSDSNVNDIDRLYETVDYTDYDDGYNDEHNNVDEDADEDEHNDIDHSGYTDVASINANIGVMHSVQSPSSSSNNPHPTTMSMVSSVDSRDYGRKSVNGATTSRSSSSRRQPSFAAGSAFPSTTAGTDVGVSSKETSSDRLRQRKRRIEAEFKSNNGGAPTSGGKTPVVRNSAYDTVRQRFFENGVTNSPHKVQQHYKLPNTATATMNGGSSGHGGSNRSRTTSHSSQDQQQHKDPPPQLPMRKRGAAQTSQSQQDEDGSSPHQQSDVYEHSLSPTASSTASIPSQLPIFHSNNHVQFGQSDSFADLNMMMNKSQSKLNCSGRLASDFDTAANLTSIKNDNNDEGHNAESKMGSSACLISKHPKLRMSAPTDQVQSSSNSLSEIGTPQNRRPVAGMDGAAAKINTGYSSSWDNSHHSISLLSPGMSPASHHNLGASSKPSNSFSLNPSLYNKSDPFESTILQMPSADDVTTTMVVHSNDLYDGIDRERKEGFRSRADTEQSSRAMVEEAEIVSVDGGGDNSDESGTFEPYVVCGITCNMWITKIIQNHLSLHHMSLCIVKSAPCFWLCCCDEDDLQGGSTSDRLILGRLNVITFFFTCIQLGAGVWLATIMFWITGEGALDAFAPHLWNANGAVFSLGIIGGFIMFVCLCTVRIIREVDLTGAIRYMWIILWLFPAEIFFTITLFDYHRVTEVWVVHWWTKKQLSWFRQTFCLPETADTLCAVPIDGGPDYEDEEAWCRANYGSTQCETIRNNAQDDTIFWLLIFYTALASWSVVLMFVLLLVINSLERIISKPIIQKSRESNVPGWLTFPTIATAFVGLVYYISPSSVLRVLDEESWVAFLYLLAAGLFLVALIMGWGLSVFPVRSDTDKRSKSSFVVVFIVVLAINAALLLTIFVASIVWSRTLDLDQRDRGDVACVLRGTDCTNCDAAAAFDQCPEWTFEDVYRIAETQLKQSATLAAIFILYAVNVMIYGIVLKRHLANYQIDYV